MGIVARDTNGHMGSVRQLECENARQESTGEKTEYLHIGPDWAEKENGNGKYFRKRLQKI